MGSRYRCRVSPSGVPGCLAGTGGTDGTGGTGSSGIIGDVLFSNFFALMPGDNADTVGAGTPIDFPQDGPSNGAMNRINATTFEVLVAGTYQITWQASIAEAGQLVVAVDLGSGFAEVAETVVGRATGTSQIVGDTLLELVEGDLVQIWNPTGNAAALTLTPIAGGTHAVSATLSFVRLGS